MYEAHSIGLVENLQGFCLVVGLFVKVYYWFTAGVTENPSSKYIVVDGMSILLAG